MKRKILMLSVLVLALPVFMIALVQAVPLAETNNDKFQAFGVVGTQKFSSILSSPHEYIPSIEKVNKLLITQNDVFLTYDIIVGGNTYSLGEDFTYTGIVYYMIYDPVFSNPVLGMKWPSSESAIHIYVDYTYDFSAVAGGIEGTLHLHCVRINNAAQINSLAGTGDLQNVQIHATLGPGGLAAGIITLEHVGMVSGWPE